MGAILLGAISLLCTPCYVIVAVQPWLCNLCYAIFAMLCNGLLCYVLPGPAGDRCPVSGHLSPAVLSYVWLCFAKLCYAKCCHALLCNHCFAILAMQSLLCNLCNAIFAMQSLLCFAMQSLLCNLCYAILVLALVASEVPEGNF